MIISQTRIRKVEAHLSHIEDGENFTVGLNNLKDHKKQLIKIGFDGDPSPGDQLLPGVVGNTSSFNANGRNNKLTDEDKEIVYHQREHTWEDWGGYEHSKIVDVPYKRYPREFIEPPSEELKIVEHNDKKLLVSDELVKQKEDYDRIKHIINLFLEIFGECIILNDDYEQFRIPKIKRKNWDFLPPGEYPWDKVEEHVEDQIENASERKRPVIEHRIKTITQYTPKEVVLGRAGWDGYMVFGWPEKNIFILEHPSYGNATYVFNDNWEQYSDLTKREIISGDLHKKRLVHREGWPEEISHLLN